MPRTRLLVLVLGSLAASVAGADATRKPAPVDFTRDVRPILADRCFQCHGPDAKTRKAGLRLDDRDAALKKGRSGAAAIVPGDPAKSELIVRVRSSEMTEVMPPAKVGKPLTPREIDLLERWVREGAPYPKHWAYVAPTRPPIPRVCDARRQRNPIDAFVLARLDRERLSPSPEADRATLLRRLSFDLTGLPPTLDEAERFFKDSSPGSYERLVDRLLASPAFGERWAVPWLDLARYADSQGYANDPDRSIWPWRDWVVRALNGNVPYDRFTVEQLAGDLLPGSTADQQIATGFHRNTLNNSEGGITVEEFRSAAVVDRVNTTFSVWLASTMACAQCHTHKYDPFSQKEFYQAYAIFNASEDTNGGIETPTLTVALPGKERERAEVEPALAAKRADRKALHKIAAKAKALDKEIRGLETRLRTVAATTPVLRELPMPRPTHIHVRGEYESKGEAVTPNLPASLPAPKSAKVDRLALARWLVDETNPLTARVAVNRLWEELFGVGIVETSEDFGTQGDLPSHPELLDWLATEYMRSGWDTKRMLRLIVTSAAYRQASGVSDDLAKRDPHNRLLGRGPRVRLSAEMVRDQALAVGGLLSRKMAGPPVQPPRPNFALVSAFGSSTDWSPSPGEDRLRRGLYTRIRRNAPYPSFTTFDAPERTFCNVRRLRTNTPLQALVTLNDPVFFEAAQALARRVVAEGGETVPDRVRFAFRVCLTRPPTPREAERLKKLYESAKERFASQPAHAESIATRPLGPIPAGMSAVELAAWTIVANTLLNLDETIAKR